MRKREKVFSILAILSSVVGGLSLILLSVFDTKRYMIAHRLFLLTFMLGVWFTAIFSVVEVRYLRTVRFFCPNHSAAVPLALEGLPRHVQTATRVQDQGNDCYSSDTPVHCFWGCNVQSS